MSLIRCCTRDFRARGRGRSLSPVLQSNHHDHARAAGLAHCQNFSAADSMSALTLLSREAATHDCEIDGSKACRVGRNLGLGRGETLGTRLDFGHYETHFPSVAICPVSIDPLPIRCCVVERLLTMYPSVHSRSPVSRCERELALPL